MIRVPVVHGSRIPLLGIGDDALLLAAPPALDPLRDVAAAVTEALRYPLSGAGLADLVTRGGRATVVVESRVLPFPGAPADPRQDAVAAVIDELTRLGMPAEGQTILLAGGLQRRAGRRELEGVLRPTPARDFRGSVVVHDATSPDLAPLDTDETEAMAVHRALVDADLVVSVTAAETSERGGASTFLGACSAAAIAAVPPAASLLAPSLSPAGILGGRIAAALARKTAVIGVSIVLDHPRVVGRFHGYPETREGLATVDRSAMRHVLNALPGGVREHALQRIVRQLSAVAVLAGPPAVAHAEALLRGISLRGSPLSGQLDTIVVPLGWSAPQTSREPANPISVAAIGLGHALRLWRDASPLREGGTVVLLHDLRRTFREGPQRPYRDLFEVLQTGAMHEDLSIARERAASDPRAVASYRNGDAPHPALPYADWAECAPVLERAGRVLVGGCRDAAAARALGLVPAHSLAAAIEMADGVTGGEGRTGVLLGPPYVPLVVS